MLMQRLIILCYCLKTIFPTNMDQKSVELTTEMTELIVARSESVKNKAELSRLLDIPRMTIASALDNLQKD